MVVADGASVGGATGAAWRGAVNVPAAARVGVGGTTGSFVVVAAKPSRNHGAGRPAGDADVSSSIDVPNAVVSPALSLFAHAYELLRNV